jgi:hypothetical protein
VPAAFAGLVLMWMFSKKFRERGTPIEQTKLELKAIKAASEIKKTKARLGTHEAIEAVRRNYKKEIFRLDKDQKLKAERLRYDPPAMAKYIIRNAG